MAKRQHKYGLRTVATIEGVKGILAVGVAILLLTLAHKDLFEIADHITDALHIDPDGRLSTLIFTAADRATERGLWIFAFGVFAYSAVRFTEAYGLWHERDWAEWFALLSGALYLPWEIIAIVHHSDLLRWGILIINIFIVLYMAELRFEVFFGKDKSPPAPQ
ncbi:MAG: DUF2127 domain-containing protein [Acidobacteriaceae bacterium]